MAGDEFYEDDVTSGIARGWDAYGPNWTTLADERGFAVRALTPAEHHARFCESRPIEGIGSLECCPFRPWHDTQEPR